LLWLAGIASGEARYTAVQCDAAVGSGDHSSAEYSGAAKGARQSCGGRGLGVRSTRRSSPGWRGRWAISAPKGASFARVSLQSRHRSPKAWSSGVELITTRGRSLEIPGLPADGDWHHGSLAGSFESVVSQLSCAAGRRDRRQAPRRSSCARSRRPFVFVRSLKFTIADSSDPQLTVKGGSLLGGGTLAGVRNLNVSASDRGGGLSRVYLRVNGVATAIHSYRCDLADLGQTQVGDRLSPCPLDRTETLTTNTSAAPFKPGANLVQACAVDYSDPAALGHPANSRCSPAQTVNANGGCDRVAATNGSDANAGTPFAPYRNAQKLADSLAVGQRGCFRSGTFSLNNVIEVRRPGITLTSFPGERATLRGELKIEKGADRVTVSDLNLDGRSSYNLGPMVFAADSAFRNLDVTNYNTGICFILGAADAAYGRAVRTVIEDSRIHNCGVLPPHNSDHGIYVEHSDGAIIRHNWIYDNADRGIQLYPDAQGTQIYGNVIDGNGEGVIFSGDAAGASNNNWVRNNAISNSKVRWNVESYWDGHVGTGNVVRDNCLWATNSESYYRDRGGVMSPSGYTVSGSVIADPLYVSRFWKDFRLQAGSPCASIVG
jgi:hypothetical protein